MRDISNKWIEFVDDLIATERATNKSEVARKLKSYTHTIQNIRTGKRNVTMQLIERSIKVYDLNPQFLFNQSQFKYLSESKKEDEIK